MANEATQRRQYLPQPEPIVHKTHWPHAPVHKLAASGTYFVTAGTYKKRHHFKGADRLAVLHRGLLSVAQEFEWQLEAWAVFSNHYHFVAHSPANSNDAQSLEPMLSKLHTSTARWLNQVEDQPGRQVWHNYRETELTYQKSYLSRLNYVHQNPVKHKLVLKADLYPWCSAGWFERTATTAQVSTIYGLKWDKLKVYDEFEVSEEW